MIAFADLESACPVEAFDAAHRIDPYFHQTLWLGGAAASWESYADLVKLEAAGFGRMRRSDSRWNPDEALEAMCSRSGRRSTRLRRLSALAAMAMWKTLTVEQVGAFTGRTSNDYRFDDCRLLWAAGLVDAGTLRTRNSRTWDLPPLYRLASTGHAVEEVLEHLTYAERLAVTAGQEMTAGYPSDRHNLLTAELCLRVGEFCEVGAVAGESVSSHHHLLASTKRYAKSADAQVVREDGLRIGIEMTARTSSSSFEKKVTSWAHMVEAAADDEDMVLCFVEAAAPEVSNKHWAKLRSRIEQVCYATPTAVRRRIAERFAVARWRWWFPEPGVLDESFLTLEAARPTGPKGNRWETVDLLDPVALPLRSKRPDVALATLAEIKTLWGVPHWQRSEFDEHRWSAMLRERAGLDSLAS